MFLQPGDVVRSALGSQPRDHKLKSSAERTQNELVSFHTVIPVNLAENRYWMEN